MTYLSTWRLALAADRLAASTATTAAIAEGVGYSNAFTFSAAFTRVYGTSPTSYRRSPHRPTPPGNRMLVTPDPSTEPAVRS